jgi:hypothetical protein
VEVEENRRWPWLGIAWFVDVDFDCSAIIPRWNLKNTISLWLRYSWYAESKESSDCLETNICKE